MSCLPRHGPEFNLSKTLPDQTGKRGLRLDIWSRKAAVTHAHHRRSRPVRDEIHAQYAEARPPSHVTSIEIELPNSERRSRGEGSNTQSSSLFDSSVADVSEHTATTMQLSTGVSSSLVTPNSLRSSAVISTSSSDLPAYSARASTTHSHRDSVEVQIRSESLSQPEQVYLRH